jgi:hypothetical protein
MPWVAYGSTLLPPGQRVDNPPTFANGVLGESSLPYTVPTGQHLVITSWGIEGTPGGDNALIPWIGSPPIMNEKCLPTCRVVDGTAQIDGSWTIPAGKVVNVSLVYTGSPYTWLVAWWIQGYLESVP